MVAKVIYKIWKRKLNRLVFEKDMIYGNFFDKCDMYYIDSNGMKYYHPKNLFDLPLKRNQYLQGLLKKLEMGFNTKDYQTFLEEFEKAIEGIINAHKEEGKITNIVKIMNYVNELKERSNIQLEPTLLLEMMSVILIREDENVEEIDHKVLDLKVKQFEKDDKLRDSAFFFNSGLALLINTSGNLLENWEEFIDLKVQEMKMRNKVLNTLMKK